MVTLIIIAILSMIAGTSKAISDRIALGKWLQVKWIGQGSSNGKWGAGSAFTGWWYFGLYKPSREERFPYSSTILVWVTDGWHFFNFITYTAYETMAAYLYLGPSYKIIVGILAIKSIRGILFSLFYDKIFK